jgi:hypothetical protein
MTLCIGISLLINSNNMLTTISFILIVFWLIGIFTSYTLGGYIHIFLALAIVMLLVKLLSDGSEITEKAKKTSGE